MGKWDTYRCMQSHSNRFWILTPASFLCWPCWGLFNVSNFLGVSQLYKCSRQSVRTNTIPNYCRRSTPQRSSALPRLYCGRRWRYPSSSWSLMLFRTNTVLIRCWGLMQMWKYSLTVHQPILHRLYWKQSFCWNWDNKTSFNPRFVFLLTCSAASGSRWVSSRGTVNWIFLGLPVSMVALSVKKGDGMKRRMEWSKQRQSKRRVKSSGSETEKKNKWVPVSK